MKRSLLVLAMLAAAGACWGQTYKGEIAYTKFSGNSDQLFLANSDGSRAVSVYSAYKLRISGVDLAPGGGRVAFTDTSGTLWVLPYTVTSGGIVPGAPLRLDGPNRDHGPTGAPDFSPDGTQLLYMANRPKTEIRKVAANGSGTPVTLLEGSEVERIFLEGPRWLRPGAPADFVFTRHSSLPSYSGQLLLGFLSPEGVTTVTEFTMGVGGGPCYDRYDTARTRHSLLLQSCSTSYVSPGLIEYDLVNRRVAATYNVAPGRIAVDGHFSPDDTQIVHAQMGSAYYPDSLYRFTIPGQASLKLGKSGYYGFMDWRPAASPP